MYLDTCPERPACWLSKLHIPLVIKNFWFFNRGGSSSLIWHIMNDVFAIFGCRFMSTIDSIWSWLAASVRTEHQSHNDDGDNDDVSADVSAEMSWLSLPPDVDMPSEEESETDRCYVLDEDDDIQNSLDELNEFLILGSESSHQLMLTSWLATIMLLNFIHNHVWSQWCKHLDFSLCYAVICWPAGILKMVPVPNCRWICWTDWWLISSYWVHRVQFFLNSNACGISSECIQQKFRKCGVKAWCLWFIQLNVPVCN